MKNILVICLIGLSMIGCASIPKPEDMKREIVGYNLPVKPAKGNAMIYVVRPDFIGGMIRFNVFLNSKEDAYEMGWTRGGQYIHFELAPGQHKIYSKAENWSEILVTVKPNDIVFIRQDASMGFFIARGSLTAIDDTEGRYHVKKTQLGEVLKTKQVAVQ